MTSHLKRWLTAIIAVPLLFAIIFFGSDTLFSAVIIGVILLGVHEYHHIVFGAGHPWEKAEGMVIGFLIPLTVYLGNMQLLLAVLSFSVLLVFFTYLLRIKEDHFDILPVGKLILGFMYVPLMMSYFILIRRLDQGVLWIFFLLVLAFSGDVTAYYVGKNFGKKKLLPLVSPNKTVEGTIGLIAGSTAGCILFQQIFFPALPVCACGGPGFFRQCPGTAGRPLRIGHEKGIGGQGFRRHPAGARRHPGSTGLSDLYCTLRLLLLYFHYKMKKLSILGSTGSIGVNTLDVVSQNKTQFCVVALAAGRNIDLLKTQIEQFHPLIAAVIDETHAVRLKGVAPTRL